MAGCAADGGGQVKIIFILKNSGGTIQWEVPVEQRENFSFVRFSRGIRCDGFFQSVDMHLKYEEIAGMIHDRGVPSTTVFGQTLN